MQKYGDTPAAIAMILFTLGGIFYVVQLIFMTEAWLAEMASGQKPLVLPGFSDSHGLELLLS